MPEDTRPPDEDGSDTPVEVMIDGVPVSGLTVQFIEDPIRDRDYGYSIDTTAFRVSSGWQTISNQSTAAEWNTIAPPVGSVPANIAGTPLTLLPDAVVNLLRVFQSDVFVDFGTHRYGIDHVRMGEPILQRSPNTQYFMAMCYGSSAHTAITFVPVPDVHRSVENFLSSGYRMLTTDDMRLIWDQVGLTVVQLTDSAPYRRCRTCGVMDGLAIHRTMDLGDHNPYSYLCLNCATNTALSGCAGCGTLWMGDRFDGMLYCPSCTPQCNNCGEQLSPGNYVYPPDSSYDGGMWCTYCADERWGHCNGCERHDDWDNLTEDDETGNWYCSRCEDRNEIRRMRVRNAAGICVFSPCPELPENPPTTTFGVEIEAHFDGVSIGEYHSGTEAPTPFFSHWRAERDGSIYNGGEIISPVLCGVGGVAEVTATMDLLREMEASVTGACGQHLHVGVGESSVGSIQAVAAFLEDFLLASTGSFRRWGNQGYVPRMKAQLGEGGVSNAIADIEQYVRPGSGYNLTGERTLAGMSPYGTIEFRYPPGTLNRTQFVINHGLCHFTREIANTRSAEELKEMLQRVQAIMREARASSGSDRYPYESGGPWVHKSILEGAKFLNEQGAWKMDGKWLGFAYKPKKKTGTEITVTDEARGLERTTELPSQADIVKRLHRQLTNFYVSAHRIAGWWSEAQGKDLAAEIVSVFE